MPLGWPPSALQGITSTEYGQLAQRTQRGFTPYSATGHLTISVAAGRLSYVFGMKGPSFPVDTVCSSSLVRCAQPRDSCCPA